MGAADGDYENAMRFYEIGNEQADPILHDLIISRLTYQTAIAERALGRIDEAASRFVGLFSDLPPDFSGNIDWWHEGLTAMRDAGRHDDAERFFISAQTAIPNCKWRNSWQIPRDIDERVVEDAQPFHSATEFKVPAVLQQHAKQLLAEFQALQMKPIFESLFEISEHEKGGNAANGSWKHLYLKRLNGSWDDGKCKHMPTACQLLMGRPEVDGRVTRLDSKKLLSSTQGVAILELAPNSHLKLHTGRNNFRLLAHLGLQVPKDLAGIAVGGQRRLWEEGSVMVLDDSFLHEAWNNATHMARYVLYVSFFHPNLQPQLHEEPHSVEL